MPKNLLRFVFIFIISFVAVGCSATKDVKVRGYMQNKARVDQKMEGNAGYILGAPSKEELQSPSKTTRKIYVLEVSKDIDSQTSSEKEVNITKKTVYVEDEPETRSVGKKVVRRESPSIELPSFEDDIDMAFDDVEDFDSNIGYVKYSVQKNDTLQKVSKKFYDSYSKWPKIYEANKAILKNPDSLSEGMTLRIPKE